ncbi:hypothetical protein Cni_G03085 [Canna indica]|uniref:Uncharacterized protein n=1 Tax=Canna indica TaxID=4628 RepID=A0AAQ3JQJ7_9LILI|nr:hypothetical protein Cni_G03085 [Canna indica]
MGCFHSSCKAPAPAPDCVRVIHITGQSQDLKAPVTAGQLTGSPPKHALYTSAHLASFGSSWFRPDDLLEPGRIYFLLPHAVLRSESSAVDLATLTTRLLAAANKGESCAPPVAAKPCRPRIRSTWKLELDAIEE